MFLMYDSLGLSLIFCEEHANGAQLPGRGGAGPPAMAAAFVLGGTWECCVISRGAVCALSPPLPVCLCSLGYDGDVQFDVHMMLDSAPLRPSFPAALVLLSRQPNPVHASTA